MSHLPELPPQPAGVPWPTAEWPTSPHGARDAAGLAALVEEAFAAPDTERLGETHALVTVQGGKIVLERYNQGFGPDQTYPSWSKAKSITHALVGLLVDDGRLDIRAPADVPEWRAEPGDPRAAITLDQLLRMSSGLSFVEDYVPGHVSDVIEMLFGGGKADVAHYAASRPLAHPPGSHWSYASGTTNIVARCAARALDADAAGFEAFMRQRLFDPIGMRSPIPKFDAAGTFIGSSFCFAPARDFARFRPLSPRGGRRDGIDYARTQTPQPSEREGDYGAHWWLNLAGPGSFSANGYEGQYTVAVPDLDLVLVRHGKTPLEKKDAVKAWIADVVDTFR